MKKTISTEWPNMQICALQYKHQNKISHKFGTLDPIPHSQFRNKHSRTQVLELGRRDWSLLWSGLAVQQQVYRLTSQNMIFAMHHLQCITYGASPAVHHPWCINSNASPKIHTPSSYFISLSHIIFENIAYVGSLSHFVFVFVITV